MSDPAAQVKRMMLPDLRTALRGRGLSPAGGVETLRERLLEAMLSDGAAGGAGAQAGGGHGDFGGDAQAGNNYHRPGGQQNVGNFITGRASSRVLAPPGGGSSLTFGSEQPVSTGSRPPQQQPVQFQSQQREHQPPPPQQQHAVGAPPQQGPCGALGYFVVHREPGERLGIGVEEGDGGVYLSYPTPGSAADRAGATTHVGSRVAAVNGTPIRSLDDLAEAIGDNLEVAVEVCADAVPEQLSPVPLQQQQAMAGLPQGGAERGTTNNYHRAGGQQNVGNFMTGRASSRVLAPPGGGSSLSLADGHAAPAQQQQRGYTSPTKASPPPRPGPVPTAAPQQRQHAVGQVGSTGPVTNNYHRAGGQQNVGNFITGRSTSRVLAPPGGGSSLTLC